MNAPAATATVTKSRPWLCQDCKQRYQRPRRLVRTGGWVVGECWACKGKLERVIEPITDNCFKGRPLFYRLMKRKRRASGS
jgi:hypothetical protein